jgi:RNA polymerase sigma-70 factor, ECF subfamily
MTVFATVKSPVWQAVSPRTKSSAARYRLFGRGRFIESKLSETTRLNGLLVAVGQQKDRAAFEALFCHFAPRLKAYLLKLGASNGQAEDLAQEAMLVVWRKAALFDPQKASAATWLFTIVRNLRIDVIRRERRPEFDPDDPAFVAEPELPADHKVMREQDDARVLEAIAHLPAEQARVVTLSFFSDKPHSRIAEELDLPLGTVKSRLRLAMERIRVALGKEP